MELKPDTIELLSVGLLEKQAAFVRGFREKAAGLGIQLGWHYVLDLAWIASNLGDPEGKSILDAGAGTGVLQWWLADRGASVVSVDQADRADLSCRFRLAYRVQGLQEKDLYSAWRLAWVRLADGSKPGLFRIRGALRALVTALVSPMLPKSRGRITLHCEDLSDLQDLPNEAFEAVVAVSALEHNDRIKLERIVDELLRVLKPGGVLVATLGAARDQDWYHEPSRGWCYTDETLAAVFRLSPNYSSNYSEYDSLLERVKNSADLRENLAPMFFESGDNGMPWGIWDPKYQPVGVLKRKPL